MILEQVEQIEATALVDQSSAVCHLIDMLVKKRLLASLSCEILDALEDRLVYWLVDEVLA